jgi:hypothetical protein
MDIGRRDSVDVNGYAKGFCVQASVTLPPDQSAGSGSARELSHFVSAELECWRSSMTMGTPRFGGYTRNNSPQPSMSWMRCEDLSRRRNTTSPTSRRSPASAPARAAPPTATASSSPAPTSAAPPRSSSATPRPPRSTVSKGQITATAPKHAAGVVDVQVVTANGTTALTAADQYTFAVPAPVVSGVSPRRGAVVSFGPPSRQRLPNTRPCSGCPAVLKPGAPP